MKLAIVILAWNNKDLLDKFLPKLVEFSGDAQIYVIDNASTDHSVQFIEKNYPKIQIIKNQQNYGFAKGYNVGLQQIEADIYCLLNSDVEVTKNWTEPIIKLFQQKPNLAVAQPKILDYKNKNTFEYAGAAGGFIDKFGYPYCRGRIFDKTEQDFGQYNDTTSIMWASGACFFIRADEFTQNLFDPDFFSHMEEIDLCWRLSNQGKEIVCCGESAVYHVGGASLHHANAIKTYLNFRNNLFMLIKNLPKNQLFIIIFTRMILDGVAAFGFLFTRGFSHFLAVLKAHFSFYKNLNYFYQKRKGKFKQNYYQKFFAFLLKY
jgi:GT2 family glycosyltransferase